MNKQIDNHARTVTVTYQKSFAAIGVCCGLILFFGSPLMLFMFQDLLSSHGRTWFESLPGWMAPTMMCIGMGGGVLTILVSVVFGLLIPLKVARDYGGVDREKVD